MIKHPLYDAAVNEVRGQASPEERAQLRGNVFEWRNALQEVVDEVTAQFDLKEEEFNDFIEKMKREEATDEELEQAHIGYDLWKSKARTFKKHVSARLMAVKRMCSEAVEGASEQPLNIEKALAVVDAARRFAQADLGGSDDEYEAAVEALHEALSELED